MHFWTTKRKFNSAVNGHKGLCSPTWLNINTIHNRLDGGVTGFFRNIKKTRFGFYIKTGKEFHGIIKRGSNVVTTTEQQNEGWYD